MSSFHTFSRRRLAVLLTGFMLLVQAESLFACEMMELGGNTHECCCGDSPMDATADTSEASCCTFSQGIILKSTSGEEDSQPLLLQKKPTVDPPLWLLVHAIFYFSPIDEPLIAALPADDFISPSLPGSHTWLATLRLRI